ncbi:unnamed protein product [Rangifer tarandus platyrhynchus]|uniref:Ig-like domain-containing protein n=1 Tax=Rangifer tarandus platyrhynchus TaxID=3082113 RepID=A0ABN8YGW4_RANTA|nr:unnamed protein product [Rangifer tarandus platyrhynchus]
MAPRLLLCVALCLLGAGSLEADVTQSPRYRITETKKGVTLTCSQNMNHEAMYWYRQDPGLGPRLIYFSRNIGNVQKGDIPDGYTVSREEKPNFPLTLESASTKQTSLYLCASRPSCLEPAMRIRLFCAFCFLGVGLMDAQVTQTPRYLVKRRGEKVVIECIQSIDYKRMFWYRQDPALGLRLLHFSINVGMVEKGDVPHGYSVSRKKKESFPLTLESATTNQTSVYLCASSESTAQRGHILSAQKAGTLQEAGSGGP